MVWAGWDRTHDHGVDSVPARPRSGVHEFLCTPSALSEVQTPERLPEPSVSGHRGSLGWWNSQPAQARGAQADLAALSTGEKISNPKHYHAHLRYLRQQQRCLARRQKGSRRRERQRVRVARAHARVRHLREHALHTLTTRLVRDFDVISVEDLSVKGLARGRHARSIQDVAFGELRRQLTYKSEWTGRVLVAVDRWYPSSKSCSACRHILDELRLDQREWNCPKCGTHHDRDINAAQNLLMEGLRQLAGRDDRDLRVDARGTWPGEIILAQVLAEEARSGHRNGTRPEMGAVAIVAQSRSSY